MKKLNEWGYTKVEILIIIVLLGVVAFITINETSYAFTTDEREGINEIKKLAENQAKEYAMDHLEIFKETNTTFINIGVLVENGYMLGNEDGLVTDPTDTNKNYNDSKIKLEYDKEREKVKATFED